MKLRLDLTDQKHNRLTVVKVAGKSNDGATLWECICDCGSVKSIRASCIISGHTKSCGCLVAEKIGSVNRSHGKSKTNEYKIWKGLKTRCYNKTYHKYPVYGARGIKVCDWWLNDFPQFLKDMGPRPSLKHTIDRIDVNGNYEPSNCKWSTDKEQANNKTNNHRIDTPWGNLTLSEAAEKSGMNYNTLKSRVRYGFTDLFKKLRAW